MTFKIDRLMRRRPLRLNISLSTPAPYLCSDARVGMGSGRNGKSASSSDRSRNKLRTRPFDPNGSSSSVALTSAFGQQHGDAGALAVLRLMIK